MRIKPLAPLIIIVSILAFAYHFIAIAAIDAPHNESRRVDCGSCHAEGLLQSFWGGSGSYSTVDELCLSCHTVSSCPEPLPNPPEYPEAEGPLVQTHLDSGDNQRAECLTCHDPHYQKQKNYKNTDASELYLAWGEIQCLAPIDGSCPYDSDSNTTILKYDEINYKSESGWNATTLRDKTNPCRRTILFPNVKKLGYSYLVEKIDEGLKTITVKGNAQPAYQYVTSTSFAVMYGQFIRDNINGNPVKFFDQTGTSSFADGIGAYNGVCEVCHTLTDHYRNDGGAPDQNHSNVGGADGTYCISCHSHVDGFVHGGECEDCHGHENDWPGGPYSGTTTSHATHTENDSDDLKGPFIDCDICHDTNDYPKFYDGKDLSETDVCNPCHSPGGDFDGVDDSVIGAKNTWKYKEGETWIQGVYKDNMLRAGKEKWCTGCHDDEAPTIPPPPDPEGVTAKNVAGDNTAYGYFVSGHGKYDISCTDCHDPQITHMDGYNRTYDASTIDKEHSPYDGIDGPRGYQQGYRLKDVQVDGQPMRPMYIPRLNPAHPDYDLGWWADPKHFALCYSCHSEGRIRLSNMNNFVDLIKDRRYHWDNAEGQYWGHISLATDIWWDSDRRDDDPSGGDSALSCTTCHNPHGKNYKGRATFAMTRNDMGIVHKREVMWSYGYMESGEWKNSGGDLKCMDCHEYGPTSKYFYQLGTQPPEEPAFWTKLDEAVGSNVIEAVYGSDGTFLGGSFATYNRYHDKSETGIYVVTPGTDAGGEPLKGCRFPTSNLNSDDELYGETIEFWYVPNFNFSEHTNEEEEYLFHSYKDADNWIFIQVYNRKILFQIRNEGTTYRLNTVALYWNQDEAHHIVCTWGPAFGMHIYLDGLEPEYTATSGLTYTGGMSQLPPNFYIGNSKDGLYPALGIIDDFKIYGYQYQKFENGLALFSKMGSSTEVTDPEVGNGGSVNGAVSFSASGQHGNAAWFDWTGAVEFPTTNLNPVEDTIDFWYFPRFDLLNNTGGAKHLFYCEKDADNFALIKINDNKVRFRITKDGIVHTLQTTALGDGNPWYHIVCTWGPDDGRENPGMHIYINDKEADYTTDNGKTYYDGVPLPVSGYFQIGNKSAGANNYCNGYIDELRIYGYQASPPNP